MGSALVFGLLEKQIATPQQLLVGEKDELRRAWWAERGIAALADNAQVAARSDILLLAVKPVHLDEALAQLQAGLSGEKLVISMVTGASAAYIRRRLPGCRVVRVMPNTPALVGKGIAAISTESGTEEDLSIAKQIFGAVGEAELLPGRLMEAATGLSGSGPAFVYEFIEALTLAGVRLGLPALQARKLAAQTVEGAARMVTATGETTASLREKVTSPGGTTVEGLAVLADKGFSSAVMAAVTASARRAGELNRELFPEE